MTDPKIVARDLLSALFMDRGIHAQEDNLKILEQALLSERTTAYKAGMERIIELVDSPDFYVKPRERRSEYLRSEANKEIK